jgi:hypothetical protein
MWGDLITSDVLESRAYVYTWVTEYGEESPPSPPVLLTGWSNGIWNVTLWQPNANDLGGHRNIKKVNLYRTVPGEGGATVFFFVEEFPIGTEGFTDDIPNSTVALNDQLASTNWFPPPANLLGMTVMQNGMVAGFTGNEIWFCEPYRPHAWPPGYVLTTDFPIVGMGMTGSSLVVCTAAAPYVVSGMAPSQMNQVKCSTSFPCISRASILGGDRVVTYMSPVGLIQVNGNGVVENSSDRWITRQNWQQLVPQKHTARILLASGYYCMGSVSPDGLDHSVAQQGFTIELGAGQYRLLDLAGARRAPARPAASRQPTRWHRRAERADRSVDRHRDRRGEWRGVLLRLHRSGAHAEDLRLAFARLPAERQAQLRGDEGLLHGAAEHAGTERGAAGGRRRQPAVGHAPGGPLGFIKTYCGPRRRRLVPSDRLPRDPPVRRGAAHHRRFQGR